MKIVSYTFIILFSVYVYSDSINEISCDDDLILVIDEQNMTEEEILLAKEENYNLLLLQQSEECISNIMSTQSKSASNNKGGQLSGVDISPIKIQSTIGSSLTNTKLNQTQTLPTSTSTLFQNGTMKCLEKYKDDDEFSIQLKESIDKAKDPLVKKELLTRYAKYNNIKIEDIKC